MNREIKFRIWAKNPCSNLSKEEMVYLPKWTVFDGQDLVFRTDLETFWIDSSADGKAITMQFIGAKDENGKDIYEGDIIETKDRYFIATEDDKPFELGTKVFCSGGERKDLKPERMIVEYKSDLCGFYPFSQPAQGGYECEFKDAENCIVIGNIFENPELWEEKIKTN